MTEAKTYTGRTFGNLAGVPFALYLLFAALYLGVQMFQGFSFLDIGMYSMGYGNFVSDPYASCYLGQWIMTYDVTFWLCRLLGIHGFIGLRIMHLALILVTQTVVYLFLRRYIDRKYIIVGLLLATLSHYGAYTELTYNDYSAFLLLVSLLSFHSGVERERGWMVFASGFVAGMAVFFRAVNITYIGIPLVSCLAGLVWKFGMGMRRRIVLFYSGMAAGMAAIVCLLYVQGLLPVLRMTVADIVSISADKSDSHGVMTIMRKTYELYTNVLGNMTALALFSVIVCFALSCRRKALRALLLLVSSLLILFVMNFSYYSSIMAMAICVAGTLAMTSAARNGNVSSQFAHLFIMSMYMPLVMPIGSNAEPSFYGKELCFLSLPMAMYALLQLLPSSFSTGSAELKQRINCAVSVVMIAVSAGFVAFNVLHKQMEDGNRLNCRYTIDSPLTNGIMTTQGNAEMYSHLLRDVKPLVPKGSYMICNFSLPAVTLLECKPWAVYSTVYSTDRMNDRYIEVAWQHTRKLPYLLLDKECPFPGYSHIFERLNAIAPYSKVWTDGRLSLYYAKETPAKKCHN